MQPLDDSKVRNLLHTLEDLVKSSLGPSGRLLFFHIAFVSGKSTI